MKVCVTGGAGFIGSHYVRAMLAGEYAGYEDAEVTVVDLLTYAGNTANLPMDQERLTFVRGDIRDADLLASVLPGHDAVVHFAAESHVDRSLVGAVPFASTNVLGTQQLLDSCLTAGIRTVLCVSTDEVYGSIDSGCWDENEPLLPNSPYSASKAGSDLVARAAWRTHGLDVRITRCSNNYGPYQNTEKLIPLFITNLLRGRPVGLYGDGANVREWLHVADHCAALQLVLTDGRPGEIYNIGSGVEVTNASIADRLVELCGADPGLIRYVADRKGHDLRYALDLGKITKLGFTPAYEFAAGLESTVRWYRDHPSWWAPDAG
ncbi:dTDP-glucose 4,6-dehydratase [Streptomyces sp. NBC_01500]|uniref:dTDP-glucose 4,6-dehydratase n=1 Tax=Streptomyces sp. NBC_01500 TaxID=2903886 RepID=UPI00225BFABB|nr:dTDP-glucose 4,6-dehydratase [Streptomyces sp. NBC_01500]MCX4547595.1 dTDP-glucose 4,6-dehydratase [Streptomyces sp. NBC_01500]